MDRHAPTVVIVVVAAAALSTAVILGGPRIGYVPGIVISTVVVLAIIWRYHPPLGIQWLAVLLLAAYHAGGTLMVGSDVLAHVSLGDGVLRYDRGLHVFGAIVTVLLVAVIAARSRSGGRTAILAAAFAAGLAVEAVELFNAVVAPNVFSYDLVDSSFDVVGNIAGVSVGLAILVRTEAHRATNLPGVAA